MKFGKNTNQCLETITLTNFRNQSRQQASITNKPRHRCHEKKEIRWLMENILLHVKATLLFARLLIDLSSRNFLRHKLIN